MLGPSAAIAFVKAGAFMCSGLMYRGLTCAVLMCGVGTHVWGLDVRGFDVAIRLNV